MPLQVCAVGKQPAAPPGRRKKATAQRYISKVDGMSIAPLQSARPDPYYSGRGSLI